MNGSSPVVAIPVGTRVGKTGSDKASSQFFAEFRQLYPQMDALFASADAIVTAQENRFRALFPDLSSTIPVVFMPSLFSFNGRVMAVKDYGRPALLMGVDFIAKRHDNRDILFSHEFFHAYHESHLPEGSNGRTMATPLWKEGFATYVSGVLNPHESDEALLMNRELAQACADSKAVSMMAADYLKVITTNGVGSYEDWFMTGGKTSPNRRGYCLGLNVLRSLAKKYPVTEMVNWDETRFSSESITVLNLLSGRTN